MTAQNLEVVYKPVGDLLPYVNNARTHSEEQVNQIASSIKEFGFTNPILIDGDNGIIAGHGRLLASKKLGLKEVPTIELSGLNETQKKAYILADNRLALNAGWDEELLKIELQALELDDYDLSLIGFTQDELGLYLKDDVGGEDELERPLSEALTIEPVSTQGTVWILGNHRLMCGDSTNPEDVKTLCEHATLFLSDPPYGVDIVENKGGKGRVGSGGPICFAGKSGHDNRVKSKIYPKVKGDETTETAKKAVVIAQGLTDKQIIFGGNYFTDFLTPSSCWLVWDKRNNGDFADCELAWTSFSTAIRKYEFTWNGLCREGSRADEGITRIHPTQKPVGLMAQILTDYSKEGDTVLDLFGGSGSTLIACEKIGRKCFMMEYEPAYIDLIVKRWQNYTGLDAIRESDGMSYNDLTMTEETEEEG